MFTHKILFWIVFFCIGLPIRCPAQVFFTIENDIAVQKINQEVYQQPWSGGFNAPQFSKADINGNGLEELIVYERSLDIFQVFAFENDTYQLKPELSAAIPKLPAGWVLFVDYNADGKKDIFSNGDRGIVVYENISAPGSLATWQKVADPLLSQGTNSMINVIANASDVPAIADVDGDGDVDILVYNFAIGGFIRWHKNLSMENHGNANHLEFEFADRFWGGFEECDCNIYAFLPENCFDIDFGRVMHPGGKSLLLIDNNGNGLMDFIGGHEQCDELYFLENVGTAEQAKMESFSIDFPNEAEPAIINTFPAAYYEDVNVDGRKDLIVAPNIETNLSYQTNYSNSIWHYQDKGTGTAPDFSLQQIDFLQGDMIDLGENAIPLLIDIDKDGDLDLLVASNGYKIDDIYYGRIALFENTGNNQKASFSLINNDYLNLSALKLVNPRMALADLSRNGRPDLVFTGFSLTQGIMRSVFFNNTGSTSAMFMSNQFQDVNLPVLFNDNPVFVDVDKDGDVDLLVGKRDGSLHYYRNQGSNQFALETSSFLGIERDFTLRRLNLSAALADFNANGEPDLFTTDATGKMKLFRDFRNLMPDQIAIADSIIFYNSTTDRQEVFNFGKSTWLSLGYLYNDNFPAMVVGTAAGGLRLLRYDNERNTNTTPVFTASLYPNPVPAFDKLRVRVNIASEGVIYTVTGQQLTPTINLNRHTENEIDTSSFSQGMYLFVIQSQAGRRTLKFIVD
ncbi:MAG: T9SS type A sorting domain-containing protein [Cyclobacteriaceae bacterium]